MDITSDSESDDQPLLTIVRYVETTKLNNKRKKLSPLTASKKSRKRTDNRINPEPDDFSNIQVVKESNLTRYSVETCKICHMTFFNQMQILMHNVKHMTVTLEVLPFTKCNNCSETVLLQNILEHSANCKKNFEHNASQCPISIVKDEPDDIMAGLKKELEEELHIIIKEDNDICIPDILCYERIADDAVIIPDRIDSEVDNILQTAVKNVMNETGSEPCAVQTPPKMYTPLKLTVPQYAETELHLAVKNISKKPKPVLVDKYLLSAALNKANVCKTELGKPLNLKSLVKPREKIIMTNSVLEPVVCHEIPHEPAKTVDYQQLIQRGNFTCPLCCKIFTNRYNLAVHKQTHLSVLVTSNFNIIVNNEREIPKCLKNKNENIKIRLKNLTPKSNLAGIKYYCKPCYRTLKKNLLKVAKYRGPCRCVYCGKRTGRARIAEWVGQ